MSTSSPATSWWPDARKQPPPEAAAAAASAAPARFASATVPRLASAASPQPAIAAPPSAAMQVSVTNRLRRRLRLPLALPQLDPADLSRERLREVVHELDLPRVRVLRQPVAHKRADLGGELVTGIAALREHDEGLHDVAAPLVGGCDGGGLAHSRMLDARGLHLERANPVAGRDDHVVGAPGVPDVTLLVHHGSVLRVEPVAAERLARRLLVVPVAQRVMRVRPCPQADLAALAAGNLVLVLVEELHVPARHRPAHRALAHVHPRIVRHQRIRLSEPVVVEHRQAVLLAEPA